MNSLLKITILLFTINLIFSQTANDEVWNSFQQFMQQNNKPTSNQADTNRLYNVYRENYNYVKSVQGGSFTAELNKFATMTNSEFKTTYLTLNAKTLRMLEDSLDNSGFLQDNSNDNTTESETVNLTQASSFDWRSKGAVSGVKDQGQCGCCWAFSTIAAVEGAYAKKYGKLLSLSEKQLLDCDSSNSGCNGGNMEYALNYIKKAGGVALTSKYPYSPSKGSCRYTSSMSAVKVSGYSRVSSNENTMMQALANNGPLAVAVDASRMQFYGGGVYTCSGAVNLNHGVTIVGYGSDRTGNYWIVKNSWGSSWGMNGYIYIKRGTNECGIANYVVSASVQ
jgi:KDEL-tailed cysteine endopeptidase